MADFLKEENRWLLAAVLGAAVVVILLIIIVKLTRPFPKKIEDRIRKKDFLEREEFLASWKESKEDHPGCYLILIYDKKLIFNPMHYDAVYIGQSVNVRKRVFSHFSGRGNGEVYYGLKSGCRVFVLIAKCSRKKLNRREKELIAYFDATGSLNMTRGGAASR